MATENSAGTNIPSKIIKFLVVAFMLFDGGFQLFGNAINPDALAAMMKAGDVPLKLASITGLSVLVSAILYAIPRTTVLGAILLTGYLGGAIAIDMRASGPAAPGQITSMVLGIMTWGALYLRYGAIRQLIPFNSAA